MPLGEIRLSGHRIGLYHVIEDCKRGLSPQGLQEKLPTLSLELIQKVLEYYQANQGAIDAYMARCRKESERGRRQGGGLDIADMKHRASSGCGG